MPRLKREYNTHARLCAVVAWYLSSEVMPRAVGRMQAFWCEEDFGPFPVAPVRFITRHVNNLLLTGTLADRPGRGRKPRLAPGLVNAAAAIMRAGFTIATGQPGIEEHHGFASIKEALRMRPALASIRQSAGVTPKTLWRRIKAKYPDLGHYVRDAKAAKSEAAQAMRQSQAQAWLSRRSMDPAGWLERQVWFDEGCILISHAPFHMRRREIYSAGDVRRHDVLEVPLPKAQRGIKLFFYIAVNITHGLFFFYPTTGTTKLKRLYVRDYPEPDRGFKVGGCGVWVGWGPIQMQRRRSL